MSKTRQFIAQQGSNSTVKIFEAGTGQLYRVITVGGNIVSQPYMPGNLKKYYPRLTFNIGFL